MEIFVFGIATLLASVLSLFTPIALHGLDIADIPLSIDGLRATFDELAMKFYPGYNSAPQISASPWHGKAAQVNRENITATTTTTTTMTIPTTVTITSDPPTFGVYLDRAFDSAFYYWQTAADWFCDNVIDPETLPVSTQFVVYTVLFFAAIIFIFAWRRARILRKNKARSHQFKLDDLYQTIDEQTALLNNAVDEKKQNVKIEAHGFQLYLDDLREKAEEVNRQHDKLQADLAALDPRGDVQTRLQELDLCIEQAKYTVRQKQSQFEQQTDELNLQEYLDSWKNDLDMQRDFVKELETAAHEAMRDIIEVQGGIQTHVDRLKREDEELKTRKQTFDVELGNLLQIPDDTLKDVVEQTLKERRKDLDFDEWADDFRSNYISDLQIKQAECKKGVEAQARQTKKNIHEQAKVAMKKFLSDAKLEELTKEVLREYLESALSDSTSGNLALLLKQTIEAMVSERLDSQLSIAPAVESASSSTRPLGQVGEVCKPSDKPSQDGAQKPKRSAKTVSKASSTSRPQDTLKEKAPETGTTSSTITSPSDPKVEESVRKSQEDSQGVAGSMWAPQTESASSATASPTVGGAPESSDGPSSGLQSSRWATQAAPAASTPATSAKSKVVEVPKSSKGPASLPASKLTAPTEPIPSTTPSSSKQTLDTSVEGLMSSIFAPKSSSTLLPKKDKGKQPERSTESVQAPSGMQASIWAETSPLEPSQVKEQVDGGAKKLGAGESSAKKADANSSGKKLSGTQASMWAPDSAPEPAKTETEATGSSKGKGKGVAKEPVASAQPAEDKGNSAEKSVKRPSQKKGPKKDAHQAAEAFPTLRPVPPTAQAPSVAGPDNKQPPAPVQGDQKGEEKSLGVSGSKWAPEPTEEAPPASKTKDSRAPPPRAGLVEENVGIKKVFDSLKTSRWPPVTTRPKKAGEASTSAKSEAKSSPAPAAPKDASKAQSSEKDQAKEAPGTAAPKKDAVKSASWADMAEEEASGSSTAGPSTEAAPVRPVTKKGPVKKGSSSGLGESKWARTEAETDTPVSSPSSPIVTAQEAKVPPKAKGTAHKMGDKEVVSPGLAQSKWAVEPAEASPGPSATKDGKKAGVEASRWAH